MASGWDPRKTNLYPVQAWVVAHGGGVGHEAGEAALAFLGVSAMVIPLLALVFVARFFIRSAKRDAERTESGP